MQRGKTTFHMKPVCYEKEEKVLANLNDNTKSSFQKTTLVTLKDSLMVCPLEDSMLFALGKKIHTSLMFVGFKHNLNKQNNPKLYKGHILVYSWWELIICIYITIISHL